jgi:hypothetical protein
MATLFLADRLGFRTYDPEAAFAVSLSYDLDVAGHGVVADAAEQMFRLANADDRPNRFMQRSMSVGDAVRVDQPGGLVTWFGCDAVGFRRIKPPTRFVDDAGLSEHMATRPGIMDWQWQAVHGH